MKTFNGIFAVIAMAACAGVSAQSAQRLAGDVVALDGDLLQIRSHTGETLNIRLASDVIVYTRSPADRSSIAPGVFLGTTAVPRPDGTLEATEVHVMAESLRGVGEGHHPIDPAARTTMTNAAVAAVSGSSSSRSTMTNATVAGASGSGVEQTMKLKYKGGEKTVIVRSETEITLLEPGDRSMLVPGAHVAMGARTHNDGSLVANRVTVGKNGFRPKP
jgi:hypothetical protein